MNDTNSPKTITITLEQAVERYEDLLRIRASKVEWDVSTSMNLFRGSPTQENLLRVTRAMMDMVMISEQIKAAYVQVASLQEK